jgi:hypothetical protein
MGRIWSTDKYSLIFHSDQGPCLEFKEARVKYCSLWGEVVGCHHVEENCIIFTAVYVQKINKLWLGQIQGSGIACSIRLPVTVLQGLRFSQQCCCRFAYFGMCHCVCSSCSVEVLYCFHFQLLALKMKALWCSEMLGTAHPTYSLRSLHVACLEPLSCSLLFLLISAVSITRCGLLMRQQFVTFSSEHMYPCVKCLLVTELYCFPKLHHTASSLLPGSGLIVRILCQI